jgi:dTDP-glucose 4,6-dehydratase
VNPVGPRSVYDEAKRFGEAATTAYRASRAVDTAIVRVFNTYGPRMRPDDGRAIPTFISQALAGEPLTVTGDGSQTRSCCYVDDLVDGVMTVLHSDQPGPINIGNPHEVTIRELAEAIVELTGSTSSIELVPRPVDDPAVRRPDINLARAALGWEPSVGLEDGLLRTIAWFRESAAGAAEPARPDDTTVARLVAQPLPGTASA